MKRALFSVGLAVVLVAAAVPAFAGAAGPDPITTITKSGRHDTRLYVGINWNFGDVRTGATALAGVRYARVNANDNVHGAKAEVSLVLSGAPFGFGEARVKYLAGSRETQGEIGVGYSFAHPGFLVNAGLQGPYVNAGSDYVFGKGFLPYIGIDTLYKVRQHRESSTSICPNGSAPVNGACAAPPPPPPPPGGAPG